MYCFTHQWFVLLTEGKAFCSFFGSLRLLVGAMFLLYRARLHQDNGEFSNLFSVFRCREMVVFGSCDFVTLCNGSCYVETMVKIINNLNREKLFILDFLPIRNKDESKMRFKPIRKREDVCLSSEFLRTFLDCSLEEVLALFLKSIIDSFL